METCTLPVAPAPDRDPSPAFQALSEVDLVVVRELVLEDGRVAVDGPSVSAVGETA